ncbi:MAG TPA: arylsulfotransferase family protein [Streptosporangiaceae bacterium]|nr:arylsulfotransferase family protein [Streptosporangiaceae bacterium]
MTEDLTRRRLFGLAGASTASAAGLSLSACRPSSPPVRAIQAADTSSGPPFLSRPDLTPPRITVRRHGVPPHPRYIFLNAPYSGPGHGGSIILDPRGELVWFGPNTAAHHRMNFSVQTYNGRPALTWFQGLIVQGFGKGELVIADSSYKILHTIRPVRGELADFHEFVVTPPGTRGSTHGTALITIYRPHSNVDLRAVRGPANGHLLSGVAQEIDIATGKLLFEWDSWSRSNPPVHLTETYQKFGVGDGGNGSAARPFNYLHINSIAEVGDGSGDLLISARNTWAVYRVSRKTGGIVWRMNGKKSDFTMTARSKFFFQHHVRPHSDGRLTVFDNGGLPAEERNSRALVLYVNTKTKRVFLQKAYIHPRQTYMAGAMGSAQLLRDGRMFVGWGTEPHFSEFAADGRLLLDADIIKGAPSYRAFTENWTGHPADLPAVAARHRTGGATVYASWNGATEVRSWTVFAGKTKTSLARVGAARKTGFETAIAVSSKGPYFAVHALDAKGKVLKKSAPVKIG